jgi:putative membrane protein
MMWWGHRSGSGYAVMSLGMIVVLALIVWAVIALFRTDSRHPDRAEIGEPGQTPTAGAEQILAERFARGEIEADEYHRHVADLHLQPTAGARSWPACQSTASPPVYRQP